MKLHHFLRSVLTSLCWVAMISCICAQQKLVISGTVKSTQGASIEGVTVSFFDTRDKLLGSATSKQDGTYKTEKLFTNGQSVVIKVANPGFAEKSINYKVKSGANPVDISLQARTVITGMVVDSIALDGMGGVEVSFFDVNGSPIQSRSTNLKGDFEFETDFNPGEVIRVRADKSGYYSKEEKLRILKPERGENYVKFQLPKIADRGIKANVRVLDKKSGKPIEGATIKYRDRTGDKSATTPASGEVSLNPHLDPNKSLWLRIQKPRYLEMTGSPALAIDRPNLFVYEMEREYEFPWCTCMLAGSGSFAIFSGISFFSSKSAYNNYKDVMNENRESDYDKANKRLRTSVVSGGLAVASLGGWLLCKSIKKKRDQSDKLKSKIQPYGYWDAFGNPEFGIAFQYNLNH